MLTVILGLFWLATPLLAQSGPFVTIDHPNSVLTRAFGINPEGDIVGLYLPAISWDVTSAAGRRMAIC
jgi:hypothetical protein